MPVRSPLLPSRSLHRWGALAGMAILLNGCGSALVAPGAESIVGTSSVHAPAATGTPPATPALETGSTIAAPSASQNALQGHTLCASLQSHAMLNITLLFGQTRPHGKAISASEWRDFVKNTLTPAFPAGLSVLSAQGQWQNPTTGQTTQEPARLVMILTEPTQDVATRLQTIRSRYKEQFQQQSVGVVVAPACVGF
ncbi:DUF3574 domain-containing protein [Acetobacter persici]|uniref:DUF3574 domain-containing protein n=1 Tax=Acetobacter persici TaxID=1076596 RepID=UPI0020CE38AF|nr:DUF3574 domain-containing protein [Acetobacter persici]MCP9319028.1 DUF3574 domain-containing protein [Acetobacter persici]